MFFFLYCNDANRKKERVSPKHEISNIGDPMRQYRKVVDDMTSCN